MAGKKKLKEKQILDALDHNQGLFALAANELLVSLSTIYNYAELYPSIKAKAKEMRELRTDKVELSLYKKIADGDMTGIIFYLKTQAKERGYVERFDASVANIDLSKLTNKQLEDLANGRSIYDVLRDAG